MFLQVPLKQDQKPDIEYCHELCPFDEYMKFTKEVLNQNRSLEKDANQTDRGNSCACIDIYFNTSAFCKCPPPCEEITYTISTQSYGGQRVNQYMVLANIMHTALQMNRTTFAKHLQEMVDKTGKQKEMKLARKSLPFLLEHDTVISLYIGDHEYELQRETVAYELGDLASDIGGLGGLTLGISIVSLCEWLWLLIALLLICCKRYVGG